MSNIKFTKGGFLYDSFGTEYIGPYHESEGLYFYGNVTQNKNTQLYTKEDIRRKRYKLNNNYNKVESESPKLYIPSVEPEDYTLGYIYRYVCQRKGNPSTLIEISYNQYQSHGTESGINYVLWKVGMFKWTLVGDLQYILTKNKYSLMGIEKDFPHITSYFKNLSQYAKYSLE